MTDPRIRPAPGSPRPTGRPGDRHAALTDADAPLPNFLIVGAQKAGTSWLARNLAQHPDAFLPPKEVHYFNHAGNYARGPSWYRRHFRDAGGADAIGEKTPSYLWVTGERRRTHLPHVHRRIHALLPDARLIAILREPVARAVSSARHHIRVGRVPPRIGLDALLVGAHRDLAEELGIIDMGRYARALEAYLELYDASQLLILVYEEDVRGDPAAGLQRACGFLGIDPSFPFRDAARPVGRHRTTAVGSYLRRYVPGARRFGLAQWADRHCAELPGPRPETLARLRAEYAADNARLAALLGRVPAGWPDGGEHA